MKSIFIINLCEKVFLRIPFYPMKVLLTQNQLWMHDIKHLNECACAIFPSQKREYKRTMRYVGVCVCSFKFQNRRAGLYTSSEFTISLFLVCIRTKISKLTVSVNIDVVFLQNSRTPPSPSLLQNTLYTRNTLMTVLSASIFSRDKTIISTE